MSKISLNVIGDASTDEWAADLAKKYVGIGSPSSYIDMEPICERVEHYRLLVGSLPFKGGPCDTCPKRDTERE